MLPSGRTRLRSAILACPPWHFGQFKVLDKIREHQRSAIAMEENDLLMKTRYRQALVEIPPPIFGGSVAEFMIDSQSPTWVAARATTPGLPQVIASLKRICQSAPKSNGSSWARSDGVSGRAPQRHWKGRAYRRWENAAKVHRCEAERLSFLSGKASRRNESILRQRSHVRSNRLECV